MGPSPVQQAEPNCDIPAWTQGHTLGGSPNSVQDFRSCRTQESLTPKRDLSQHLSCPEILSCSWLAPSVCASPLMLNPQPGHVQDLPHYLLILSQMTKPEWPQPHLFWLLAILVPGSPQVPLPVWGWKHASRCYGADRQASCLPAASQSLRHFSTPLILSNLII